MSERSRLPQILADLRKRKVFRSAIAYALAAWLILQAADILLPVYDAPPWALRVLVTVLVLGLPLAILLAWLFDVRPPRVTRAEGSSPVLYSTGVRMAVAAGATALTAGAIWWVWWGYASDDGFSRRGAPKALPVVAVTPLRNLTGNDELDWLGEGMANLVRDGLAESSHLVVVSPSRWNAIIRVAEPGSEPNATADAAGIDYVVSGEILDAPDGLLLSARVSDVEAGVERRGERTAGLSPGTLLGSAASLIVTVKQALGIPHTEYVEFFAADFAVENVAAYEAYIAGLGYFLDFKFRDAERAFRTALELAPEFHMACYRLAHVFAATGRNDEALAEIESIPAAAGLTRRLALYVAGARALFSREAEKAQGIYREILEEFPFDVEARWLLVIAYDQGYDDEAAVRELQALLRQEPENHRIWAYLGETYLRMGDYDAARGALDHYLSLAPEDPFGFTVLGQLALVTGDYALADERFRAALEIEPDFSRALLGLANTHFVTGRTDEAMATLRSLAQDTGAPPQDRNDAVFDLSWMLSSRGRFAAALEPLVMLAELIENEHIRESMALSARGIAHMELGQLDTAVQLIEQALQRWSGIPTRYLFARGLLELRRNDLAALERTIGEIRAHALPDDDPDRTEDKAAAYLAGRAELATGRSGEAVLSLTRAVELEGYRYAIYELALAEALYAAGDLEAAARLAHESTTDRDAADLRLDLELERTRALLLESRILADLGKTRQSSLLARRFLERWRGEITAEMKTALARELVGG
jgi:tetratricopeptide (TPR) repeat protein/TolB-like protein